MSQLFGNGEGRREGGRDPLYMYIDHHSFWAELILLSVAVKDRMHAACTSGSCTGAQLAYHGLVEVEKRDCNNA